MGCCNHIDIISSITDSKRGFCWVLVFNHVNNFCLLFGAYSTGKYNISTFAKFYERILKTLVKLNQGECFSSYYHSIVSARSFPLILLVVLNLVMDFTFVKGLENENVHLVVEKLASMTYVHSCLNFITGEDPYTDTSLSQVVNGLSYIFLKLVLNGS